MAEPTTKVEYAYQHIKNAILSGKHQAGERLRLGAIADQYGLSQMPVREALRRLQADGLVLINDHKGAIVAEFSWNKAADYVEVRTYLEIYAAELACEHHTAETRAELRDMVTEMHAIAASGDATAYTRKNRAFHEAIYAPCPNETLKSEIITLWDMVWREQTPSIFSRDSGRLHAATIEHDAIVSAIERNDRRAVSVSCSFHRDQTILAWNKLRTRE